MARKMRMALHWKILIGLVLGLVVGLLVNGLWTDETWAGMGVHDPSSFVSMDGPTFRESIEPRPAEEAGAAPQAGAAEPPEAVEAAPAEGDEAGEAAGKAPNQGATLLARAVRAVRMCIEFVGKLFLRGLQFIGPPIVLFSLIVGVSSLNDLSKLGRIGGKTVAIYLTTTALAITIGLLLANIIGPGRGFPEELRDQLAAEQAQDAAAKIGSATGRPSPWDTMLNIVPVNPFRALATTEMLQIVFAALIIGVALTLIPKEKARPVIDFCDGMTEVIIKVVHIVLLIAPYAVFALIVTVVADLGADVLVALLKYSGVVVLGLAIMMFAVYPGILRIFTPVRYGRFFRAIAPAQVLAFSSSSSGATLPVTMECVEERLGVSDDVTSFVIPLGATVNMDGTALYQGVAAVFIAQIYGLGLSMMDQLAIVLTATLASIGTAAVPGVGIVMLVIVLQAVGIPLEGIAVILGVDRILDMCRTSVNITGDCMVAAIVASTEGELATEEEVRVRRAARPLDEHPLEPGPDQYAPPR